MLRSPPTGVSKHEVAPSFETRPEPVIGPRFARTRWGAPQDEAGKLRAHRLLQVFVDLVEEAGGGEPLLVGPHKQRQVLGHEA